MRLINHLLLCLLPMLPLAATAQEAKDPPAEPAVVQTEQTASSDAAVEQVDPAETDPPSEEAAVPTDADKEDKPADKARGAAIQIAPPPEGQGQIVFFREKKFVGAAIVYKVREGETELGQLNSGTYFVHTAQPGAHEYAVRSEAADVLHLEVEPGETYYVVGSVSMGVLAGRPNLSPSNEAAFNEVAAKLKPAKTLKKK